MTMDAIFRGVNMLAQTGFMYFVAWLVHRYLMQRLATFGVERLLEPKVAPPPSDGGAQ